MAEVLLSNERVRKLMYNVSPYLSFEHVDLLDGAGVRLADDGDDVDLLVDLLHNLHIQRLQTVARGRDEVEAGVHSAVPHLQS